MRVQGASRRTWKAGLAWLAAVAIVCWLFPPFHVRPLDASADATADAKPSAQESAQQVWVQMLAAREEATDVAALLDVLERDPTEADREHGRRVGYGGPAFYFVRGEGRVVESTPKGVTLEIAAHPTKVMLLTGPVFGNALRDATDFADIGEFDSFRFNELSTGLNLLSERRVQPRIAELGQPGSVLRFVGGGRYVTRGAAPALDVVAIDVGRADR